MSILDELSQLVSNAEQVKKTEEQMFGMFKLAGFELDRLAGADDDLEQDTEPKTLIELLSEALGNPPTEPGAWIRIQDIPRYITENLIVPDRETLDTFNSSAAAQTARQERPELLLPKGFRATGREIAGPEQAEADQWYACNLGRLYKNEGPNQWTLYGEEDDRGGYLDLDVQGPLTCIQQGSPGVPRRNRNPVL